MRSVLIITPHLQVVTFLEVQLVLCLVVVEVTFQCYHIPGLKEIIDLVSAHSTWYKYFEKDLKKKKIASI